MRKKNRWLFYFIYALVILVYIYLSKILINYMYSPIIYIVFGLILGFDRLITEIRNVGGWRFNLPKFVLLGIPSLYLTFGIHLSFVQVEILREIVMFPYKFLALNDYIFPILFGYVFITCFIKRKKTI